MGLSIDLIITFLSFLALSFLTLLHQKKRRSLLNRTKESWFLDVFGLTVQGVLLPLGQLALSYFFLDSFFSSYKKSFNINLILAFFLHFIFIDYLYYWSHRILHHPKLWNLHRVHHTAVSMDLFVTSRNSLWTPLFFPYMWANALFIFIAKEPTYYLIVLSLSSSLDLFRHSGMSFDKKSLWYKLFKNVFITPDDHAIHHSRKLLRYNYSANLKLWDIIHGTYTHAEKVPTTLGVPYHRNLFYKLFWPVQERK